MVSRKRKRYDRIALPHHVSESVNHMMERYRQLPGFQMCLLQMKWPEIVGTDVAEILEPTKWFKGIIMVKGVSPSTKMMLSYQLPTIIKKINTHFGHEAVTSIRYERIH